MSFLRVPEKELFFYVLDSQRVEFESPKIYRMQKRMNKTKNYCTNKYDMKITMFLTCDRNEWECYACDMQEKNCLFTSRADNIKIPTKNVMTIAIFEHSNNNS